MEIDVSGTEAAVCYVIAGRQAMGRRKYGTTVAANPLALREWLQHALEECLDQAIYLQRAIEELHAKERISTGDRRDWDEADRLEALKP